MRHLSTAAAAIGPGQHFQIVVVRIGKIDAAAAVAVVDGAGPLAHRVRPIGQSARPDAVEHAVELRLGNEKRIVLRLDGHGRLGKVQGHAIVHLDHMEVCEASRRRQGEDFGEKTGGPCRVAGPDDGVIELNRHAQAFQYDR